MKSLEEVGKWLDDDKKSLEEVGKWLDDDKDYQISTQEKYDEFVKKRNYKFSSDGDVLVSTGQGLENWRIGKAEAVRIEETRS